MLIFVAAVNLRNINRHGAIQINWQIVSSHAYDEKFFHAKGFENLLYDSINLLYLAHDVDAELDQHDVERACARGSIINTLLLFECAANCCVEALSLSRSFAGDLDKLPVLSKFEFFSTSQGASLDRGRAEVAAIAELKGLRDGYVHPKTHRKPLTQVAPGHYEAASSKTKQLGLSKDPSGWFKDDAVVVARAADAFFNYYFRDVCKFTPSTVCSVLLEPSAATIPCDASIAIDCVGGLDRAVQDWGLTFAYLGKGV